jgi:hypothetical protein
VPGHHDFAFHNDGDGPVQVWLHARSCACSRVELGLPPADGDRLTWQPLKQGDGNGVTIPARASGIVRLTWRGEELGPHRLSVELGTEPGAAADGPLTLEAVLNFVEPVRISTEGDLSQPPPGEEGWLGTLAPGETRCLGLLAWSSTRTDFTLQDATPADPFLRCGPPERLGGPECDRLGRRDGKNVLCAYRIPVTLRESAEDGQQLDLGRFRRRVQFGGDADIDPVRVTLGGVVRGAVTVGSGTERGELRLGMFERSEGKSQSITLSAEGSPVGLEVESCPDFLAATLKPETSDGVVAISWMLTARVLPDSLIGPIPPDSVILLRTQGDRPRRIRIPVTGCAVFK